jgi:ribonuclease HII
MDELVLGIDEAGRGCIIGPLFIAGFLISETDFLIDKLNSLGVNDSKLLLPKKRDELAREIKKISCGYKILKIQPNALDKFSINDLEIQYSAKLVSIFSPNRVYMDVPASGSGIKRYCGSVASLCSASVKMIGANKMDSTNVLVASASILAKSEREKHIKILKKKYGDFGSGYSSDPKTIVWLKQWKKKHVEWPSIVRRKWSTLNKLQISNPK